MVSPEAHMLPDLPLYCARCHHPEEMHPEHGACKFHTCECAKFLSSEHIERHTL